MTEKVTGELTDLAAWLEADLLLPAWPPGGPSCRHLNRRIHKASNGLEIHAVIRAPS